MSKVPSFIQPCRGDLVRVQVNPELDPWLAMHQGLGRVLDVENEPSSPGYPRGRQIVQVRLLDCDVEEWFLLREVQLVDDRELQEAS